MKQGIYSTSKKWRAEPVHCLLFYQISPPLSRIGVGMKFIIILKWGWKHGFIKLSLWNRFRNGTAADDQIPVRQYHGLAGGNGPQRFVEFDPGKAIFLRVDG